MAAATITVQVLSGGELEIMAEPGELVALVRQRVADQIGIGEFQEVKLCMGFDELRYDEFVGESGMLDSTVQAVLVTNVCKAKTIIKQIVSYKAPPPYYVGPTKLQPFSLRDCMGQSSLQHHRDNVIQRMLAVDILSEMDYDSEESRKLLQTLAHRIEFENLPALAHMVTKKVNPMEALRSLGHGLTDRPRNIHDAQSTVWIELIDTLAPYDGEHAEVILCALASFHSAAAVRVAAVRAFGLAPIWALRHISSLKRVLDCDPDELVRDAAEASAQALEDVQATPPAVRLAPPALRGPPPRRNTEEETFAEGAKLQRSQEEDLQSSAQEDLQREQQALQEAILRSKADAFSADGIILTRLTFHSPSVMSFLSETSDLARCRATVESAGCVVQPAWANGALLLVPVTEQQILEADINLQPHNILMLASDEPMVRLTLTQLARRKRPGLKPEHYPHGKLEYAFTEARNSTAETKPHPIGAWMQEVGIVVERTFLHFAIEKDISEASTIVHSAPAGGSAPSRHMNPHRWRLPRPTDER